MYEYRLNRTRVAFHNQGKDMPFEIDGWIELAREDSFDVPIWSGAVRIGSIIEASSDFSETLFGFSKALVAGERTQHVVTANRGVPVDSSPEVAADVSAIRALEAEHGTGEFGGFTHATWAELKPAIEATMVADVDDWRLLFDLIYALERRIPAHKIRFVVWYCW